MPALPLNTLKVEPVLDMTVEEEGRRQGCRRVEVEVEVEVGVVRAEVGVEVDRVEEEEEEEEEEEKEEEEEEEEKQEDRCELLVEGGYSIHLDRLVYRNGNNKSDMSSLRCSNELGKSHHNAIHTFLDRAR